MHGLTNHTAAIKNAGYLTLRWGALVGGALLCLVTLVRHAATLPWADVLFLSAAIAGLSVRTSVMQRAADGAPTVHQASGDALILIALLRDGAAATLAVSLLAGLVAVPLHWRIYRNNWLPPVSNFFYLPALFWLSAHLYTRFGGHDIRTPDDCALFFHEPLAILLPLLAMLVLTTELLNRPYLALLNFCRNDVPLRETLRDPMLSFYDYIENLAGVLILILWTTWGWATVPLTALIYEALLMSGNNYFERIEARRDSDSDTLTGLASWRKLSAFLRRRIADHTPFALLFLDVDGLKRVNDQFGHGAGDELLRAVGECCRLHARGRDLVGRRSGDEFLLVLDGLDRAAAERVTARLQRAVEDELAMHPLFSEVAAGASIGVAVYPADAHDENTLVEMADRQMYHNKRARKATREGGVGTG